MLHQSRDLKTSIQSHIDLARAIIHVYAKAEEEAARLIRLHGKTVQDWPTVSDKTLDRMAADATPDTEVTALDVKPCRKAS